MPEIEEPAEDTRTRRKWDPEILVIADLVRTLDDMDPAKRARAVAYLMARYSVIDPRD